MNYEHPPLPPPPRRPAHALVRGWRYAAFTHLSGLIYLFDVPGVIGPLLLWLFRSRSSLFVDEQGKEAMNFQLTMLLCNLALVAFTMVTLGLGAIVAVPLGLVIWGLRLVLTLIASISASNGRPYRYPFTLRIVR